MSVVLVTSGSAFIASYCILQLLAARHQVRTTVRNLDRDADVRAMLKQGSAEPGDRLSCFAAELTQDAGWCEPAAGSEYVRHVASRISEHVPKSADENGRRSMRPRGPIRARATCCLTRDPRLWPSARLGISWRRKGAASNFPLFVRSWCSVHCSRAISRPRPRPCSGSLKARSRAGCACIWASWTFAMSPICTCAP